MPRYGPYRGMSPTTKNRTPHETPALEEPGRRRAGRRVPRSDPSRQTLLLRTVHGPGLHKCQTGPPAYQARCRCPMVESNFMGRWVNTRGKPGPISETVRATIPR